MSPNELSNLRLDFLTWQCRLRQTSVRDSGGRPSSGMCPLVLDTSGNELSRIIVLLIREDSHESTEFLKFQTKRHNSPEDIYKNALKYLQATHYHRSSEFLDELTALFGSGSDFPESLISGGECILRFGELSRGYDLRCSVRRLSVDEPSYDATLWHNRVFNPNLSDDVTILGFLPDWSASSLTSTSS